jgi:DNA polymerase III alpha subunit
MNILPIFYDHSSKKSILTYWKDKELTANGPRSIIKICKDNNVNTIYGISNNFATFIEAYKNCRDSNINFRFGVELWMCDDAKVHNEESLNNEHKIIIFAKNSDSYKDLVKIYSACHASRDNFYYKARFDFKQLKPLWTNNLILALPFFDSVIANNTTSYNCHIIPDFPVAPIIMREQGTEHPMEETINRALDSFNSDDKYEEVKTKTIFYEKRSHFDEYTVYRCIHNRGASIEEPKMDYFCSPAFSFEDYLKLANS